MFNKIVKYSTFVLLLVGLVVVQNAIAASDPEVFADADGFWTGPTSVSYSCLGTYTANGTPLVSASTIVSCYVKYIHGGSSHSDLVGWKSGVNHVLVSGSHTLPSGATFCRVFAVAQFQGRDIEGQFYYDTDTDTDNC